LPFLRETRVPPSPPFPGFAFHFPALSIVSPGLHLLPAAFSAVLAYPYLPAALTFLELFDATRERTEKCLSFCLPMSGGMVPRHTPFEYDTANLSPLLWN